MPKRLDKMRPVIVSKSGKIEGIRGLYQDRSGRYYVRVSVQGIDRQKTVTPKNSTFSGLEIAAGRTIKALRAEILASMAPTGAGDVSTPSERIDAHQLAQTALQRVIRKEWARLNARDNSIRGLLRATAGMCLCSTVKNAATFDEWNSSALREILAAAPEKSKTRLYRDCNSTFKHLIALGLHKGANPAGAVQVPVKAETNLNKAVLDFDSLARVYHAITGKKALEMRLFFRLCVETGQRPADISHMTWDKLETTESGTYYHFISYKTRHYQRVKHKLSPAVASLLEALRQRTGGRLIEQSLNGDRYAGIWTIKPNFFKTELNKVMHSVLDSDSVLYDVRSSFITHISDHLVAVGNPDVAFYSRCFTHEGRDANEKHYRQIDQSLIDNVLNAAILRPFAEALDGESREIRDVSPGIPEPAPAGDVSPGIPEPAPEAAAVPVPVHAALAGAPARAAVATREDREDREDPAELPQTDPAATEMRACYDRAMEIVKAERVIAQLASAWPNCRDNVQPVLAAPAEGESVEGLEKVWALSLSESSAEVSHILLSVESDEKAFERVARAIYAHYREAIARIPTSLPPAARKIALGREKARHCIARIEELAERYHIAL